MVWPSEDPNEGGGGGGRGPARTPVIRPAAADRQAAKVWGGGRARLAGGVASTARLLLPQTRPRQTRERTGGDGTAPPPPSTGPAVLDRLE